MEQQRDKITTPAGLTCLFEEIEPNWICKRCGITIPKHLHPTRPFAACKVGMEQMDYHSSNLVVSAHNVETPRLRSRPEHNEKPGSELKKILTKFGIKTLPDCSCNQKAAIMDNWGCDLCEERLESHIIPWLKNEAVRRNLPFSEVIAKIIVKRAINKARKNKN